MYKNANLCSVMDAVVAGLREREREFDSPIVIGIVTTNRFGWQAIMVSLS